MSDYRDVCIEDLCTRLRALEDALMVAIERAVKATTDRDAYRVVLLAALQHANDLHCAIATMTDRATARHDAGE